ncbi:MerR family transcriptional regulator [Bhargavaea cecembensis]|uniref:MerR family transcriptional regulator n=1 Tax=Bhargavaea cecembensis TaxID=394098 RepID=UPI000590E0E4|nr:MerR family transcriptional regulator [Bhargavaea cecembensis]
MKTIREMTEQFGVTSRTLRYYEELGLLDPERTEGGRRLYPTADVVRMKLITRGKRYGFSLDEIKEMVLLFDKDRSGRAQLERTIRYGDEKLKEIDDRIRELKEIREEIVELRGEFAEKLNQTEGGNKDEQF